MLHLNLGFVTYAYNPSTCEVEETQLGVQGQPQLHKKMRGLEDNLGYKKDCVCVCVTSTTKFIVILNVYHLIQDVNMNHGLFFTNFPFGSYF